METPPNPSTTPPRNTSGDIDAAQLARITGLSERRLRQLSQFGAIPHTRRNRYPLWETLHGIFRHYRQQDEERALRNEYPSFKACSEATKIPLSVLHEAKRQGCPALSDGRVRLVPFLQWYYAQHPEYGPDLESEQALKLRLQNAKLECVLKLYRDEVLPVDTVKELGARLGRSVRRVLTRTHLLAPSIVGMPLEQIEVRLLEVEAELEAVAKEGLDLDAAWKLLSDQVVGSEAGGQLPTHGLK